MRTEAELIRSYLLGTVSSDEASAVENRYFHDDVFFERMELAEDELVEAYVRGDLWAADRLQFEKHFLLSPRRQRLTEVAALMWRTWPAPAFKAEHIRPNSWFARLFARLPSLATPAYALVTVSVLLAGAAGWLTLQLREQQQAATERERLWSAEQQAAQAEIARLGRELKERQAPPSPAASSPPGPLANSVVAFALSPGVFRAASAPPIELPAGVAAVSFTLTTDLEPRARGFQVILRLGNGREIWRTRWSSVSGVFSGSAEVLIPGALLQPDQYVLEWSAQEGADRFQPLDDYSFTIVREK